MSFTISRNDKEKLGVQSTTNIGKNLEVAIDMEYGDMEGTHEGNTDDALKQEVNPTHAVNPSVF